MGRNYVAVPFEYLDEMRELDDAAFGRLMRILLQYGTTGEIPPKPTGDERFYFTRVINREDRFRAGFDEQDQKLKERGKAGAKARWSNAKDAKGCLSITSNANDGKSETETETKSETETNITPPIGGSNARKKRAAPTVEAKKSFGAYGWVKLTESEYNRLLNDLGQAEVNRCIAYVDESAQSTGNKNKWRDWNLVVRKCHRDQWGASGKAKASGMAPGPNFASQDRQAAAEKLKKDADWMQKFLNEQNGA